MIFFLTSEKFPRGRLRGSVGVKNNNLRFQSVKIKHFEHSHTNSVNIL